MPTDIVMPNLGFDTQTARLVEWLKAPGQPVQRGDIIAVIESDKANVELESIASGILLEQLFPADTDVTIGAVIARIGKEGEQPVAASAPQKAAPPAPVVAAPTPPKAKVAPPPPPAPKTVPTVTSLPADISRVARRMVEAHQVNLAGVVGTGPHGRITREDVEKLIAPAQQSNGDHKVAFWALPKVRQLAREQGIDLTEVPATGSQGQITLEDLANFIHAKQTPPPPTLPEGAREIPLSRIRQIIGQRLGDSMREAPHFYVTGEFDLEAALQALNRLPAPNPRLNDLIQYVVIQCLLRIPELNATFEDGHLYQHESINLAMAVARDDGLITPVIQGAERFSLQGLAKESRALIGRARENRLQPADLQGGTFTISNLGVIKQVDHFTAVINPPQVAILAVGTVKQRPVVINGGLFVHHTVHLTLSGDHRVVDGMHLGRFMALFQEELDRFSA